ncbi:MAG: hypothetical protein ABR592_09825 [Nitriliruptorales bacterium]
MNTKARGGASIVFTLATALGVALLTARPGSSLTPPLVVEPVAALVRVSEVLRLDDLSDRSAGMAATFMMLTACMAFLYALWQAWRRVLPLRRILVLGVLLHVLAFAMPLFLSRDVYSYAIYGRMFSAYGANPYLQVPADFSSDPIYPLVSSYWKTSPSAYGPAFTLLSAAITSAFASPQAVVQAFKLLAAGAGLATLALTAVAASKLRPARTGFAAALVALNPVVVFHTVAGAHNDTLVGLSIVAAAVLLLRNKQLAATAVLTLGTLVKVVAAVPLILVVTASVAKRPSAERITAAAHHAAVVALVALPLLLPFVQSDDPTLGVLQLSSRWLVGSEPGHVLVEFLEVLFRRILPWVLLAFVVGLLHHLVRMPQRADQSVLIGAMGWAALVTLVTAPRLWPWYAAWMLPLAWLLPRPGRAGAVLASVALAMRTLIAEPGLAFEFRELTIARIYLALLVLLAVLARLLLELWQRLRHRTLVGGSEPLLAEQPALAIAAVSWLTWLDRFVPDGRGYPPDDSQPPRRRRSPTRECGP